MLNTGTRLGHYEVLSAIGAGGMGEVYLAQDVRLNRRVALKVLPAASALDEIARKRMLQEARAVAALEHPNICALYDIGEAEGHTFLAMQYVEGETLAARLQRGPLDVPSAVGLVRQVAEALSEAHRQGIIHRDIKPQNIMVSRLNQAKVLDFGLAKATGPPSAAVDTASALTVHGAISGTMPYMSPEQLRGETIDGRSDVFSVGTVLYEALAGTHPFTRSSWADTISAILTVDPAWDGVPGPPELQRIVRKCLDKDRERRYQTMSDLAIDLETLARAISAPALPAVERDAPTSGGGRRLLPWMLATGALAVLVVVAGLLQFSRSPSPAAISSADYQPITDFNDTAAAPALSPDGQMVAFIRGSDPGSLLSVGDPAFLNRSGQIYVKRLPNGDPIRLTNDPRPKLGPVFTADGSRVAYTVVEVMPDSWSTYTVPISGGEPTRLLPNAAGLQWIDKRRVLFSQILEGSKLHMALVTSTEDRAEARTVYVPEHVRGMAHFSYLSPDRKSVLVVEMGSSGEFVRCRLVPFDNASPGRDVGPDGVCRSAAWSPDGRWMYFSAIVGGASHLWRQRFPDGAVEPLTSGSATEEHGVAVALDGRSLITALGRSRSTLWLHDEKSERVLSSEGFATAPVLASSGARLYYLLRRAPTFERVELTRLDLASGTTERLLPDYSIIDFDISTDETEVAFTAATPAGAPEIWVAALDRSSAPRLVVRGGDNVRFGPAGELLFREVEGHASYIARVSRDGKTRARAWKTPVVRLQTVSPDKRWVVTSSTSGDGPLSTLAVSLDTGATSQICPGLCWVAWSPDGRWLHLWPLMAGVWRDIVLPLPSGRAFPEFPSADTPALAAWSKLPAARSFDRPIAAPTNDVSSYVFLKNDDLRNLFRIPLPQ